MCVPMKGTAESSERDPELYGEMSKMFKQPSREKKVLSRLFWNA